MASEDLTLKLRATGAKAAARDVDKTSRSVDRFGRNTKTAGRNAGKTRGPLRLFSSGLRGMGSMAAGAGAALGVVGLTGVVRTAISEFRESQKVTKDTAAALKSTGAASWISGKQVGDLSDSLAKKTGVDDEVIQKGANMLLTFKKVRNETGKGSKIFNRATTAAGDLSARGFGSISASSKALGKALDDPAKGLTALKKSGVNFSAGQKKRIEGLVKEGKTLQAQKIIMKEVESQVKGSAAAQADPINKLKQAWGQLMEMLGAKLLPTINRGVRALTRFVGQIQSGKGAGGQFRNTVVSIAKHVGTVAGKVKAWTAALFRCKPALIAVGIIIGAMAFILVAHAIATAAVTFAATAASVATGAWAAATWILGAAIAVLTSPITLVIVAIALLVAAFIYGYNHSKTFKAIVDGVVGAVKSAASWVGNLASKIKGPLGDALTWIVDKLKPAWDLIKKFVDAGPIGSIIDAAGSVADAVGGGGGKKDGNKARGGVIPRGGGSYNVGERGRERVHLPGGSVVEPHGGFGGGGDTHVTVMLPNGEVLGRAVARAAVRKKSVR